MGSSFIDSLDYGSYVPNFDARFGMGYTNCKLSKLEFESFWTQLDTLSGLLDSLHCTKSLPSDTLSSQGVPFVVFNVLEPNSLVCNSI